MHHCRSNPLDVAFDVNSVARNGGLDHAFELLGDHFQIASVGFVAVGRQDIALLLSRFLALIPPDGPPASLAGRSALLESLTESDRKALQNLVDNYDLAPDPQIELERQN